MSLTRRDSSLVQRGAVAAGPGSGGGAIAAERLGRVRPAAAVRPLRVPGAGRRRPWPSCVRRATTATSKACCSTGLRLVEAGRPRPLGAPQAESRRVTRRPSSINTDPRLVVAAANALRRMGAASVVVAEGPGHRRDTEAVIAGLGHAGGARRRGVPFVDLNDAPLVRTPLRTRYTGLRELWVPQRPPRDGARRLDAEAQDASLGRRHAVAEELLRLHAGPRLRVAEGRLPRPRRSRSPSSTSSRAVRPSLAIMDGIVGMEGDGPIMGDPVPVGRRRRLARPRGGRRHGGAADGHGSREGAVPDGGGALPRSGAVGADRAARRGSRAARDGSSARRRASRTSRR